ARVATMARLARRGGRNVATVSGETGYDQNGRPTAADPFLARPHAQRSRTWLEWVSGHVWPMFEFDATRERDRSGGLFPSQNTELRLSGARRFLVQATLGQMTRPYLSVRPECCVTNSEAGSRRVERRDLSWGGGCLLPSAAHHRLSRDGGTGTRQQSAGAVF